MRRSPGRKRWSSAPCAFARSAGGASACRGPRVARQGSGTPPRAARLRRASGGRAALRRRRAQQVGRLAKPAREILATPATMGLTPMNASMSRTLRFGIWAMRGRSKGWLASPSAYSPHWFGWSRNGLAAKREGEGQGALASAGEAVAARSASASISVARVRAPETRSPGHLVATGASNGCGGQDLNLRPSGHVVAPQARAERSAPLGRHRVRADQLQQVDRREPLQPDRPPRAAGEEEPGRDRGERDRLRDGAGRERRPARPRPACPRRARPRPSTTPRMPAGGPADARARRRRARGTGCGRAGGRTASRPRWRS